MTFSSEWNEQYSQGHHQSIWPWSDVVSLMNRFCKQDVESEEWSVLELGCGAGANIPFFLSVGANYYGVDGSASIIELLQRKYPGLAHQIRQADFTAGHPFQRRFQCVLDRAAITHNDLDGVEKALRVAFESLDRGGTFIGVDWLSTKHSDFFLGDEYGDKHTRTNIRSGQFANVGNVHFFDERQLRELLSGWNLLFLEEKVRHRCIPPGMGEFAAWDFVARKPRA